MNQDQNTAEKITKLTSEQVAEYLRINPEFFENNLDLLSEIQIPHVSGEGTVSLIERQVQLLRDQVVAIKDQLNTFAVLAGENEDLWVRFKDLALMLLNHADRQLLKSDIESWLKKQFNLSGVMINLNEPAVSLNKFKADEAFKHVFVKEEIHCSSYLSKELLTTLFGKDAKKVNSCALIPLKKTGHDKTALLALGSENSERFTSSQSTSYLGCLSQLISQALLPAHR